MKRKVFPIVSIVLGLLLALGVMTVFRACGPKDDGTYMHCHSVQHAVLVLGLVLAALAAVAALVRGRMLRAALSGAGAVLALVTALLPGTIMGMCMMDTMRCHAVMKPYVIVLCVLIAAADAAGLVQALSSGASGAGARRPSV